MVKQTYFGNWARDYSQAIDVGTVKSVSAEAIRLLLCVLGFMTFGYGSGEFEVTSERLGCYRPEEHIDNPKNYADNEDARQYDRRLRGPVDEEVELAIDPETGMKNYIANERVGIMTSAQLLRSLLGRCIELGRKYKDSGRDKDLYESLRLLGTGLHCLEGPSSRTQECAFHTEVADNTLQTSSLTATTANWPSLRLARRTSSPMLAETLRSNSRELRGPFIPSSRTSTS